MRKARMMSARMMSARMMRVRMMKAERKAVANMQSGVYKNVSADAFSRRCAPIKHP